MQNTFGSAVSMTIFGESHGPAVGAVLDGLAAGLPVDTAQIAACMDRRRARGDGLSTARTEPDEVEILSGLLDGHTTGTPLTFVIRNTNTRSGDYARTAALLRPGHADYTAFAKYEGFQDAGAGDISPAASRRHRWRRVRSAVRYWRGWASRVYTHIAQCARHRTTPPWTLTPCPPTLSPGISPWQTRNGKLPCSRPSAPREPRATAWAASWKPSSPASPPVWGNPSLTAWRANLPT